MALTKVTDSIVDFDTLTIAGTQAADTTYLKLQNTPATAATHKVAMEFWGNEGTANGSTFNMGRIYGEFDGSSYSTTRLTLGSASGNGTFNDEINIKNGKVGIGQTSNINHILTVGDELVDSSDSRRITIRSSNHGANAGYRFDAESSNGTARAAGYYFQPGDNDAGTYLGLTSTDSAYQMTITRESNVGIGATGLADSQHRLKLTAGTGGARCLNMGVGNGGLCATTNNTSGTASYDAFAFTTSGGGSQVGGIVVGGSSTAYNTTSDYRLKENVNYTWDATTRLKQLRPARFNWIIDDTNTLVDGFLAHEVEDIVPEAITGTKDATETLTNVVRSAQGMVLAEGITEANWTAGKADGVLWTEDDVLPEGVSVGDVRVEPTYPSDSTWDASLTKDVYQNIDQAKLVPLLVKTIQELEARITTLENA